jgi:hypothetical protein
MRNRFCAKRTRDLTGVLTNLPTLRRQSVVLEQNSLLMVADSTKTSPRSENISTARFGCASLKRITTMILKSSGANLTC